MSKKVQARVRRVMGAGVKLEGFRWEKLEWNVDRWLEVWGNRFVCCRREAKKREKSIEEKSGEEMWQALRWVVYCPPPSTKQMAVFSRRVYTYICISVYRCFMRASQARYCTRLIEYIIFQPGKLHVQNLRKRNGTYIFI